MNEGIEDPLLPPKAIRYYTESYVGRDDARNPLISPVYGGSPCQSPYTGDFNRSANSDH